MNVMFWHCDAFYVAFGTLAWKGKGVLQCIPLLALMQL